MGKKSAHDEPGYTMEPKAMGAKGCDVCGRTGIEGKWGVVYSSTVDKKKLHACLECFAHRHLPLLQDQWKKAVDKAFPNLVQYWADKPKEEDNDEKQEGTEGTETKEDKKDWQDGHRED